MKRILLLFSVVLCFALTSISEPARPGCHSMIQSDGTTIHVFAEGNAFKSVLHTSDGLMLGRGSDGDFYYYSSLTGLTKMLAHNQGERNAVEQAFISAQRSNLVCKDNKVEMPSLRTGGCNTDDGIPAFGVRKIPVLLVQFKDKKFGNSKQQIIDGLFNGDVSIPQYFKDQSNILYKPQFDVYGIVTLSQNRAYYGAHDNYGADKALGTMVVEACQLASAAGVSFGQYDTNGDETCDVVVIIFAGVGESQASAEHPEALWPCQSTLDNIESLSLKNKGISDGGGKFRPKSSDPYINRFIVVNELYGRNDNSKQLNGIGTFCHEFGHCLGLPDFYSISNIQGHYGMGNWSIMHYGGYANNTYTPIGYSAYEKVFMGWIEYVTPYPGTYYTLPVWNQKNMATDKAVCITSSINKNEYFIFENRSKQGWDAYLPCSGILVTHVVYSPDRWRNNTVNDEDIQLFTILPADNKRTLDSEQNDTWPYQGKNAVTDTSSPATVLNLTSDGVITTNAGYLGKPVTEMVINSNGMASFWYMKNSNTTPTIIVDSDNINFENVPLSKSEVVKFRIKGQSLTGSVTVSISDANGVFSVSPTTISNYAAANGYDVSVTFKPTNLKNYSATMQIKSNGAQTKSIHLYGKGTVLGYIPVVQDVDQATVNLTSFCANWTDETNANNVSSYTLEVQTKPKYYLLETADFANLPNMLTDAGYLLEVSSRSRDFLPDGWIASSPFYVYGGSVVVSTKSLVKTRQYDFTGYDKVTVKVNARSYQYNNYGNSKLYVSTGKSNNTLVFGSSYETKTTVLDVNTISSLIFQANENKTAIRSIEIYAGDMTSSMINTANETGNATYRLISNISGKHYQVNNLKEGGTFIYKVKGLYIDGTESDWSNVKEVTLSHNYPLGDVNHDGKLLIDDLTRLIDILLSDDATYCSTCADLNKDGIVSIVDLACLIDLLLIK